MVSLFPSPSFSVERRGFPCLPHPRFRRRDEFDSRYPQGHGHSCLWRQSAAYITGALPCLPHHRNSIEEDFFVGVRVGANSIPRYARQGVGVRVGANSVPRYPRQVVGARVGATSVPRCARQDVGVPRWSLPSRVSIATGGCRHCHVTLTHIVVWVPNGAIVMIAACLMISAVPQGHGHPCQLRLRESVVAGASPCLPRHRSSVG